jgi:hypothetical protein
MTREIIDEKTGKRKNMEKQEVKRKDCPGEGERNGYKENWVMVIGNGRFTGRKIFANCKME